MIDDVTYECAPKPLEVKFLGYNVYRDGNKINDQPLSSATFTDEHCKECRLLCNRCIQSWRI